MKKLVLTAVLAWTALSAFGQRVREADVATVWREGLSQSQVNAVDRFVAGMEETDRWSVYSAVVRSKEFHRDYLPGEPMTEMKVISAVRTRLSHDDTRKFNEMFAGLSRGERRQLLNILRDIQTG